MLKDDLILSVDDNVELMTFLLKTLKNNSRDNIKSLLRNKQVWIKGKAVSQFNHLLKKGDEVEIRKNRKSDIPAEHLMKIIHEDEHLIVIDKKAGLLSVSDGKNNLTASQILNEWLRKHNPSARVYIVHRLDQYTSGLLLFAKTEKVQNIFRNEWKAWITERIYAAVVEGKPAKMQGTIRSYLSENKAYVMLSSQDPSSGKLAITHYTTLKAGNQYSLLKVSLETGKKNQIRVHMQDIGHSIAGDRKYGAKTNPVGRLCLHATVLALKHPVNGEMLRFESPIPPEFSRLF